MITINDIKRIRAELVDGLREELLKATDELLTAKQCAEMLGISRAALAKRRQRGQLPYHEVDGCIYYSKREITSKYLEL